MQKRKRLQNKVDFLFLGLWNPDPVYEHTRHNVGMNVVSLLVQKLNAQFSLSEEGTYEKVLIDYENKKRVHLIVRSIKGGRGGAVKAGIEWGISSDIEFEAFVEMDCDFSHTPAEIPKGLLKCKFHRELERIG